MNRFIVKKEFEISYAHRLLKYNGRCENLHGHNAKIEVIIEGKSLNRQAMVEDFTKIKDIVGRWLEENLDHATLLHKDDPLAKELSKHKQRLFLFNKNPTAEIIALEIKNAIKKLGLKVKAVRFWETSTSMAEVWEE